MNKEKIEADIKALEIIYEEACYPTHDALSTEPQYRCGYCDHYDVVPSHAEKCIAIDAVLAVATMRDMLAENDRLKILKDGAGGLYEDVLKENERLQARVELLEKIAINAESLYLKLHRASFDSQKQAYG